MFQVKLSVRELVEFVLEKEISTILRAAGTLWSGLWKGRLHRRLQKEAKRGI